MSTPEELKKKVKDKILEIDGKARAGVEKLKGQALEAHERILEKSSKTYEEILTKMEERIRDHREKVQSGEFQEELVGRIKDRMQKLEDADLSAKAVEALTMEVTSDLTMLWYHRDFMERKLKQEEEEAKD